MSRNTGRTGVDCRAPFDFVAMSFAANLLAAFVFFASSSAALAARPPQPRDLWYAIYLLGKPVGGSHESTVESALDGRPCLLTSDDTRTSLTLLGSSVDQTISSRDWSDPSTGKSISEEVVMSSGGTTTTVTAQFRGRTVTAVLESGGRKETHVLTVPAGAELMTDDPTLSPPALSSSKIVYFDPATLALEPVTVAPAPGEPAAKPKRLIVTTATGSVTVTQGADGIPSRIEMPVGLTIVRKPAEIVEALMKDPRGAAAQTAADGAPVEPGTPDFAVVASVAPTGQPLLPHPSALDVAVTQQGGRPQMFTIRIVRMPSGESALATVASVRARADLAPDLANSAYLALDSPDIARQADEIAGGRTKLADIAVQIYNWVHLQMTPTPTIGLPRSAVDILSDRRGVCRDYALLYTALARKAGVPTRLCAGMVGYRGRFYYHAWAESYVGGITGWMPVDPTLYQLPVDASHIALVRGDPVTMYDLAGKIGELKVTIIHCEP